MASVLIVDDEPSLRRLLRASLEQAGYGVLEASDGPQALLLARAEQPGLILLDLALPGLSGLEVRRRLQEYPETNRTPVLLISGALPPAVSSSVEDGALLLKPFTPATLLRRVESLLGVPSSTSAA